MARLIAVHPERTFEFELPSDREEYEKEMAKYEEEKSRPREAGSPGPKEPAPPAVFRLKPISAERMAEIDDDVAHIDRKSEKVRAASGSRELKILRAGLVGWKNVFYADGSEAKFITERIGNRTTGHDQPSEATLSTLPLAVRKEIVEAIEQNTQVSREELGN